MTTPSAAQTVHQDRDLPTGCDGMKAEGPGLPQRLLCSTFRVRQYNDVHARAADLKLRLPLGRKRLQRIERIREAGALLCSQERRHVDLRPAVWRDHDA